MNSPSNMSGQGSIDLSVDWLCSPDKLSFVLKQNMLITSLNKEALNPKMCQDSQSALRMTERVSRDCNLRVVIKLLLEIMETQLKIFDDIIIVGTSLVMLNIASSKYFPIFRFQYLLYLLFILNILLAKPSLEEPNFAVEEGTVGFLSFVTNFFPQSFALPKYFLNNVENVFDWSKAVRHEISQNITFIRFRIIVALEIENPEGIKMRMHRHVQSIRVNAILIIRTIFISLLIEARIAVLRKYC